MNIFIIIVTALAGYFIGAISFARIITRIFAPDKKVAEETVVGLEGSDKKMVLKTVSASSVSAQVGSKFGFITYVLDMFKIFIPVLILKQILPGTDYFLIFAVMGVVGHIWPVYYGFKGGRGLSTIYGGVLAIDWIAIFTTSIGGMLIGLLVLRDVFSAYMAGIVLLIPWLWFRFHDTNYLIYAVIVNILYAIAIIPEARHWFRIRKEQKWNDPAEVIQLSGMGRGLLKMAKKLGFIKDKPKTDISAG